MFPVESGWPAFKLSQTFHVSRTNSIHSHGHTVSRSLVGGLAEYMNGGTCCPQKNIHQSFQRGPQIGSMSSFVLHAFPSHWSLCQIMWFLYGRDSTLPSNTTTQGQFWAPWLIAADAAWNGKWNISNCFTPAGLMAHVSEQYMKMVLTVALYSSQLQGHNGGCAKRLQSITWMVCQSWIKLSSLTRRSCLYRCGRQTRTSLAARSGTRGKWAMTTTMSMCLERSSWKSIDAAEKPQLLV